MNATCAKKRLCNPPVKAAVESADGMVEIMVGAVKDGLLEQDVAEDLILEMVDSDERYCAEQKAIGEKVIAALGGLPQREPRRRRG